MDRRMFLAGSLAAAGGVLLPPGAQFASMTFPKDFPWGTATAAYQVEGAWNVIHQYFVQCISKSSES